MGRRVRKEVYAWNNAARAYGPMPQTVRKFIYDDWNLVAELDARDKLVRSYVWGPDLSGSLQGAGGIGGLLFINDGDGTYCPCYDGNANIVGMVNADNGTVAARYEYGPYGQVLAASGEYAAINPFRFSTKYADPETGLAYFGFRYYHTKLGRWINRDPIDETGGDDLYGYVRNDAVNRSDALGREPCPLPDMYPWPYIPPGFGSLEVGKCAIGAIGSKIVQCCSIIVAGVMCLELKDTPDPGYGPCGGIEPCPKSPPGNCTEKQHGDLHNTVDSVCKQPRSCDGITDPIELQKRLAINLRCMFARNYINSVCFDGGDKGHRRQAEEAGKAAQKCWDKLHPRPRVTKPIVPYPF